MKINIILFKTTKSNLTGDFENAFQLYKNLQKQGHNTKIFTANTKRTIHEIGLYTNTEWSSLKIIKIVKDFIGKINSFESDVDITHIFYPSVSLCFLNCFINKKNSIVITHIANPLCDERWYRLLKLNFKRYLPRLLAYNTILFKISKGKSDFFVVSSEYQKKQLIKLGVCEEKLKVIYNFVNFDNLNKNQENKYLHQKPIVCYIGHFSPPKGVGYLVQAFKIVKNSYPTASLILAWSGNGDKDKILNLIKKENIAGVIFLEKVRVGELIRSSDVLVLPYVFNFGTHVFPSILLEALFVGARIVTTDIAIIRELLHDGKSVYLAKPKDGQDLARKIIKILKISKDHFAKEQSRVIFKFKSEDIIMEYKKLYGQLSKNDDSKARWYAKKDIVENYEKKRFGGKSGEYINNKEMDFFVRFIEKNIKGKILDMPVGTGRLSKILKAKNKNIIGADFSKTMLQYAQRVFSAPLYQCDARQTNFKNNEFEAVVSMRFFQHFQDIEIFIKEIKRITKNNGYILFDIFGWSPRAFFWVKRNKIYSHSIKEIECLGKKYHFKMVGRNSKFLLPPLILRWMPLNVIRVLSKIEKFFPDRLKVRHFFIFKNLK